jgi:hypothetical protein
MMKYSLYSPSRFIQILSRYFQNFSHGGGEIWINLDYENRSQLSRGNIYALTNEIAPRMHGEI